MARKPVKWKIVCIGFGILVSGILMIILWDTWGDRTGVVNPLGVSFVITAIFVIGWGFRIRFREV